MKPLQMFCCFGGLTLLATLFYLWRDLRWLFGRPGRRQSPNQEARTGGGDAPEVTPMKGGPDFGSTGAWPKPEDWRKPGDEDVD